MWERGFNTTAWLSWIEIWEILNNRLWGKEQQLVEAGCQHWELWKGQGLPSILSQCSGKCRSFSQQFSLLYWLFHICIVYIKCIRINAMQCTLFFYLIHNYGGVRPSSICLIKLLYSRTLCTDSNTQMPLHTTIPHVPPWEEASWAPGCLQRQEEKRKTQALLGHGTTWHPNHDSHRRFSSHVP